MYKTLYRDLLYKNLNNVIITFEQMYSNCIFKKICTNTKQWKYILKLDSRLYLYLMAIGESTFLYYKILKINFPLHKIIKLLAQNIHRSLGIN